MINLSQGVGHTVQMFPPDGVTSLGASVEWVVEQATDWFPYFYAVRFNDCAAVTQSRLPNVSRSRLLDLDPDGTPLAITDLISTFPFRTATLAQGSVECPTVAAVRWEAFTD